MISPLRPMWVAPIIHSPVTDFSSVSEPLTDETRFKAALSSQLGFSAVGLEKRTIPVVPPGGALLRMRGCGLCGSDVEKVLQNKVLLGTVLGHEVVGQIEVLAEDHTTAFTVGERVVTAHHVPCGVCHYCLNQSPTMCRQFKSTNLVPGGFSEYIALSEGHLKTVAFSVPGYISDEEATCVEPLACVLRGIARGGSGHQSSVAIIGLGFIGLLAAQIYALSNRFTVFGLDRLESRLDFAGTLGFVDQLLLSNPSMATANKACIQQATQGRGVDVVFLTVITPETLETALQWVRDGGTLVLFAAPAKGVLAVIEPSELYRREISVVSSYSPSLQSLEEASQLIFHQKVQVAPLVTHRFSLAELPEAIQRYQQGEVVKAFIYAENP